MTRWKENWKFQILVKQEKKFWFQRRTISKNRNYKKSSNAQNLKHN